MKKLKLVLMVIFFLLAGAAQAQVPAHVTLASQPMWGPVGYNEVCYYYIPAVECYYDVEMAMFIYLDEGAWIGKPELPRRYRKYDLYHGYKVVMTDTDGTTPYMHFRAHKVRYSKKYRGEYQVTLGERQGKDNPKSKGKPRRR